jgi:hypothetical protein
MDVVDPNPVKDRRDMALPSEVKSRMLLRWCGTWCVGVACAGRKAVPMRHVPKIDNPFSPKLPRTEPRTESPLPIFTKSRAENPPVNLLAANVLRVSPNLHNDRIVSDEPNSIEGNGKPDARFPRTERASPRRTRELMENPLPVLQYARKLRLLPNAHMLSTLISAPNRAPANKEGVCPHLSMARRLTVEPAAPKLSAEIDDPNTVAAHTLNNEPMRPNDLIDSELCMFTLSWILSSCCPEPPLQPCWVVENTLRLDPALKKDRTLMEDPKLAKSRTLSEPAISVLPYIELDDPRRAQEWRDNVSNCD